MAKKEQTGFVMFVAKYVKQQKKDVVDVTLK